MKKDFEKRLTALEAAFKSETKSGLWVTMSNNRVRIDKGTRRGVERSFNTIFEAARFVESEINKYDNAYGRSMLLIFAIYLKKATP